MSRRLTNESLLPFRRFFNPDFFGWLFANWHIYEAFEREALALIARGRMHYSARTIIEVLVHNSLLYEAHGSEFKIGNHRAPDLARLFVLHHPQHRDFWEYRRPDWPEFKAEMERLFDTAMSDTVAA